MRTAAELAAFHRNARTGLAGIYALSVPAIQRRHQNRRMMGKAREEYPEETNEPRVVIKTLVERSRPDMLNRLEQAERQLREHLYPKTQAPVKTDPQSKPRFQNGV